MENDGKAQSRFKGSLLLVVVFQGASSHFPGASTRFPRGEWKVEKPVNKFRLSDENATS